jgi:hypothetical protein
MKRTTKLRRGEPVMTRESKPKPVTIEKLPIPKRFRRLVRAKKNKNVKYRGDRLPVGSGRVMYTNWDGRVIHLPRRKKLKGWQKENCKYRKVS